MLQSKIKSDQKRLFFAISLYPLSFFANTPFNTKAAEFILLEVFASQITPPPPFPVF